MLLDFGGRHQVFFLETPTKTFVANYTAKFTFCRGLFQVDARLLGTRRITFGQRIWKSRLSLLGPRLSLAWSCFRPCLGTKGLVTFEARPCSCLMSCHVWKGRPCIGHVWDSTLNVTWEASNVTWCFMDGHGCHVWSLAFTKLKRDMGEVGNTSSGVACREKS
ncbi:hypothetical protein PIB30_111780, partial [Stylosanthes scabra]|nr:hypothetical protein [Stylosanthes scabra]